MMPGAMLPRFLTALSLSIALAAAAPAGTAVRLTLADLADRSDLCLEAKVTAARAILESGKRIDTEYTLSVLRTFWGEAQASRAIRLPGGVLPDGRGMVLPGLRGLEPGEEVLLFLSKPDPLGMRVPIGLAQGTLRVETDKLGRKHLVPDERGLAIVAPGGAPQANEPPRVLDYAAAVAEIESALAARRARENAAKEKGDR